MIDDELLNKWLNEDLTDAEKKAFSERDDFAFNQRIIEDAKRFKASEFSKTDSFETFKKAFQKNPKVKSINWIKPLLQIASVFILGFTVYYTFLKNEIVETNALAGEQITIDLPDTSVVTLNADSEISYDKASWATKRSLNLKGEAYFKVAKGKTFDVVTNSGMVTVVGTEFTVKDRKNYYEVKCFEGIVKVKSDTIIRQLLAGDTYRILNDKFSEDKINITSPEWLNKRSVFKAVPLFEVILELERQYNIKVKFKNTDTSRIFSGAFVHNNLENALSAITQPMNLTFELRSSNQVLIHGQPN